MKSNSSGFMTPSTQLNVNQALFQEQAQKIEEQLQFEKSKRKLRLPGRELRDSLSQDIISALKNAQSPEERKKLQNILEIQTPSTIHYDLKCLSHRNFQTLQNSPLETKKNKEINKPIDFINLEEQFKFNEYKKKKHHRASYLSLSPSSIKKNPEKTSKNTIIINPMDEDQQELNQSQHSFTEMKLNQLYKEEEQFKKEQENLNLKSNKIKNINDHRRVVIDGTLQEQKQVQQIMKKEIDTIMGAKQQSQQQQRLYEQQQHKKNMEYQSYINAKQDQREIARKEYQRNVLNLNKQLIQQKVEIQKFEKIQSFQEDNSNLQRDYLKRNDYR
ncbi:hypothetical protein PPERSA_00041 [Pseudocohnilembus persalinus]|uniref:Uncharacterized protein n=1 Tax=Pseudocohnilembus persalinus TaxID=266149 RepID=A0A0V0Q8Q2_PSEPJ|nr:hypothetical protein PPERSA_00041 [Pseudocohnilembus persalinus]|eukprot:KRW98549.1 hypothetical protein PPERSA_00041 [Pseudocohnilembus persalinus]